MNTEVKINNGSTPITILNKDFKYATLKTAGQILENDIDVKLINIEATAQPSDILAGQTAYVNGTQITGTINNYNLEHRELSSITITTPPTQVHYCVNSTLDLTGMVVSAIYNNGDVVDVTANCTFNPANGSTLALTDTNIIVTYESQTCIQAINIWTPLCFTANTAGSTVAMSITGTPTLEQNFSTSTDLSTWTEFVPGTTTITLTNSGDKVYFKGNNPNGIDESEGVCYKFSMTGSITGSGNTMSLIDDGACNTLILPNTYCFNSLFANCTSLTVSPALPAITLTYCCYQNMFKNCTALVNAPALPAIVLANECYASMFYGCTALVNAPLLPATTLASECYSNMFSGCTLLTVAPTLPATTLAIYCYEYMFMNCTSLVTAPSLLATKLTTQCYVGMFAYCTALTTAPALPATTLALGCYQFMFYGCTALIVSDTSGTGYDKEWTIPTSGTFTKTYSQYNMFADCAGSETRASNDMAGAQDQSYTYYTQNTPV